MRPRLSAAALIAAGLLLATSAVAQTAAAPPPASTDKAALSKSCSDQANAKGLHGKARKHFRGACRRGTS